MKKFLRLFTIVLLTSFFSIVNVNALPESLGVIKTPASNNQAIDGEFNTFLKYSDTYGVVFCSKHNNKTPGNANTTCSINEDWNIRQRAGVAAIIDTVGLENISTTSISNEYFEGVYAINQFLYSKSNGEYGQDILSGYKLYPTSTLYNTYTSKYEKAANEAYDNAVAPSITISPNKLTFKLENDKYISNEVTITSDVSNDDIEVKAVVGTLNKLENGKYTVSIEKNKIEIGKTISLGIEVTAKKTVKQARNYGCGEYIDIGDYNGNHDETEKLPYQTVTPASYDTIDLETKKAVTGEILVKTSLTIKKLDENKKQLSGVEIKVESEENNYSQTFTTTTEEIKIENIKLGKYIITEVSTLDGYVKLKDPVEIIISEDNLNEVVTLTNELIRVEISKISSADSKLLSGAVLQIQDKDGNVLVDENDEKYEWTSKDEVHVITGLAKGTYYLVEISAPEGYELNKEKIEFEVDGEKSVVRVEMKNNIEVKVPNTLSSRSALLITISMFDIFLGIGIITYVKKSKIQE